MKHENLFCPKQMGTTELIWPLLLKWDTVRHVLTELDELTGLLYSLNTVITLGDVTEAACFTQKGQNQRSRGGDILTFIP